MSDSQATSIAATIENVVPSLSEFQNRDDELDAVAPKNESLSWPNCQSCGQSLDPEIPPCFCPHCAAFNVS